MLWKMLGARMREQYNIEQFQMMNQADYIY